MKRRNREEEEAEEIEQTPRFFELPGITETLLQHVSAEALHPLNHLCSSINEVSRKRRRGYGPISADQVQHICTRYLNLVLIAIVMDEVEDYWNHVFVHLERLRSLDGLILLRDRPWAHAAQLTPIFRRFSRIEALWIELTAEDMLEWFPQAVASLEHLRTLRVIVSSGCDLAIAPIALPGLVRNLSITSNIITNRNGECMFDGVQLEEVEVCESEQNAPFEHGGDIFPAIIRFADTLKKLTLGSMRFSFSDWTGLELLRNLQYLDVSGTEHFGNNFLEIVTTLPELTELRTGVFNDFGEDEMMHLRSCQKLTSLKLGYERDNGMTMDDGLRRALYQQDWEFLEIHGIEVNDAESREFLTMVELEIKAASPIDCSEERFSEIQSIRSLTFSAVECSDNLIHLLSELQQLEVLNLSLSTSLRIKFFQVLGTLPILRCLYLKFNPDEVELSTLQGLNFLSRLETLDIDSHHPFCPTQYLNSALLQNLRCLSVRYPGLTKESEEYLRNFPNLEYLSWM